MLIVAGDTDAMNEAAWCYLEGFGGKKDKVSASVELALRALVPVLAPRSLTVLHHLPTTLSKMDIQNCTAEPHVSQMNYG